MLEIYPSSTSSNNDKTSQTVCTQNSYNYLSWTFDIMSVYSSITHLDSRCHVSCHNICLERVHLLLPECSSWTGLYAANSIATEMSVWEGVVVTPSDKAYEKQEEKEEEEKDGEEMETQDNWRQESYQEQHLAIAVNSHFYETAGIWKGNRYYLNFICDVLHLILVILIKAAHWNIQNHIMRDIFDTFDCFVTFCRMHWVLSDC